MAAAIQLNYCGQWAPSHRYRSVRYPSVSRILLPIDDMADYAMLAEVVKALIVANHFLETDLEKLRAAVSTGYARGKLFEARDRKDWYE
jgi:hypothetical protein